MADEWFIYADVVQGPFTPQELLQAAQSGRINSVTLVCKRSDGRWVPASSVKGLLAAGPSGPTQPASSSSVAAPAKGSIPPPPPPPPHLIPVAPPAQTAPAQAVIVDPSADAFRRTMLLIIGGGVTVVALMMVGLIVVIALFGTTYLRKVDDEVVRKEAKRLADEDAALKKQTEAEKARKEREEFEQAGFDSKLAKKIRAEAPGPATPLLAKLKSFRIEGAPLGWNSKSTVVRDVSFTRRLTHGTPLLIDDHTLALIPDQGGFNFQLWHLNLNSGDLRMVSEVKNQNSKGKYDSVECHRDSARKLVLQFITLNTGTFPIVPRFRGSALYATLDLVTGETKVHKVDATSDQNMALLEKKLRKDKFPETTLVALKTGTEAITSANTKLANAGLQFDTSRGTISLKPDLQKNWEADLRTIRLSDAGAPGKLVDLERRVGTAPSCPLTSDLKVSLQFANAASRENLTGMRSFIHSNRETPLLPQAAMTLVHLIAKETDKFADYVKFQEEDSGTGARDLAILRVHEIAYAGACRDATIDGFDDFLSAFPGAIQSKLVYRYGYDLELERARFEIEHAPDKTKRREEIANKFYVKWRDSLRSGRMPAAERMWQILKDEDDFSETKAAIEAQNAKDLDIYREKILVIERERNQILKNIEEIQRQQLAIAEQQLQVSRETNAKLDRIGRGIDDVGSSLSRIASKLK